MKIINHNISIILLFCAWLVVWPPCVYGAERVAVALDVSGQVNLISDLNGFENESPLQRTDYLSIGDKMIIPEGGKVVLMLLGPLKRFTIRGPNEVLMQTGSFTLKTGTAELLLVDQNRTSFNLLASLGKNHQALHIPGAVIGVRDLNKKAGDIALLTPIDKERLLEERPVFAWQPLSGVSTYRLILKTNDGAVLLDTPVTDNPFHLPTTVSLQAGGHYSWQVVSAVGTVKSAQWSFAVLTAAEQEELSQWRPTAEAPISEHVLYAMLLEKMGMVGAARQQWQQLQERDPADPLFRQKAKQLFR